MVLAYILVDTTPGSEGAVNEALAKVEHVLEIYTLFGEYDFIVKVEAKDYAELERTVVHKIRTIGGIQDTKTLTVIRL